MTLKGLKGLQVLTDTILTHMHNDKGMVHMMRIMDTMKIKIPMIFPPALVSCLSGSSGC